jgi:hypothetical protein
VIVVELFYFKLISIGIVLLGAVLAYFISRRRSYSFKKPDFLSSRVEQNSVVKHYSASRDKIVKKHYKKKVEEEGIDYTGFFSLKNIIMIVVFAIVFFGVGLPLINTVCEVIMADNATFNGVPNSFMMCGENGNGEMLKLSMVLSAAIGFFVMLSGAFTESKGDE